VQKPGPSWPEAKKKGELDQNWENGANTRLPGGYRNGRQPGRRKPFSQPGKNLTGLK